MESRYHFPPFPDGWYCVSWSEELKPGDVVAKTLFGQEVAVPDNPACGPDATGASLRESVTSPIANAGVGAGAAVIEVIYEMVEELITGE